MVYLGFPEYLAQSIIIQSSNISSLKCHVMKLMQFSTSLAEYSELLQIKFLGYCSKNLEFTAIRYSLYNIT